MIIPKSSNPDRMGQAEERDRMDLVGFCEENIRTWAAGSVILSAALFLFVPDGISANDIED